MMKKITLFTLTFLLVTFSISNKLVGQELMLNGNLEAWDNSTTPTNWDQAQSVTQESGTIHGGVYSAKQQAGTSYLTQNVTGIIPGESYTITYYLLDNDIDARSRIWSYWTSGGSTLTDNAAELRPSVYSSDDANWQEYSVVLVAPATADGFRFQVRTYNRNAGSGYIYYDDFSVFHGGVVVPTISKAYSLSNDAIDVHYSSDVSSVDPADYILYTDGGGRAPVTFTSATIDGSNPRLIHLSGASEPIVGDLTLDLLNDNENGSQIEFYAGITPIALTNTNNPGGHIDNEELATFTGIVSANDNYNNVWISDGPGERQGVMIFDYDFDAEVSVGDEILITAIRDEFYGLTELKDPELISIISSDNTPYGPAMISGTDIQRGTPENTDPAEKWEGQLVSIEHFYVFSYDEDNYEYVCNYDDGGDVISFVIGGNVDYQLSNISLNVGQYYYHITGVVDFDFGEYRINPRDQMDVDDGIYIDVTYPNGGETLYQGYPYEITWDYGAPYWTENQISIYLYDDVTHDMTLITENIPVADGSYTWTVWPSLEGDDFMIFVQSPQGTHDYSDATFSVVQSEELIAAFEADTTIVAVGDSVMFTDMTTGIPAATNWMWTFEGGTPATFEGEEPPYIVYNEAGVWDVTLEVSNGLMTDSLTMEEYIACGADLVAGFEADTTMVAVGDSVMFTDMSFGSVTSWLWTFEGGTPATFDGEEPPYIVYNEMGMWDVTLIVSDGEETDTLTMEEYIEVVNLLTAPINLVGEVGPFDDVQFTWGMPAPAGLQDDFESYDDFVLEFTPWTNIDVDGSNTYGMTDTDWPNSGAPQAFIIFNPSMTTPPVDDMTPHSGDKFAACLAAVPSPTNDDWMITPQVGIESDFTLAFWAKSYTDAYGLERFRVGVSTTGMDPADFTIISEGDYVEAPVEDWTEFVYDLSAYEGQNVYVGINCVSNDAFVFMLDDVTIGATKSSIVYNPTQPVVGKASKSVNYTSKPSTLPEVTAQTSRSTNDELMGFNVYRDDVKINSELITMNEYNDAEPPIGSHDYYVTAVYDVGESGPSNIVSIVVTDINDISETSVNVYPNPSNGTFTISLPEGAETVLNVMDLTGKSVYQSNARGTTTINLDNMYKGIYLLNIYDASNNTKVVKKLVIN